MPTKNVLKDIVILYVEDEEDVRSFTSKTLDNIVKKVITANNGLEGLEIFKKHYENSDLAEFDLIVTDINMPKMNGLDMLKEIYQIDSDIPSVITTAHNDSNFLKQAIDLGVRGYATKPMNLFQLLESIKVAVEPRILRKALENTNKLLEQQVKERTRQLEETIKELETHSKELLFEATHDHLTTLYNRQKFNAVLDEEILRENRYQHNLALVMFDIDFFKDINDTYGHDVGDKVLILLSTLVKKSIRDIDIVARWGGEEFMLLLPETLLSDATKIAEKLRISIEQESLCDITDCNVTVSFGVCEFKMGDTKETLLKRVDDALYEAKNTGRNKVVVQK